MKSAILALAALQLPLALPAQPPGFLLNDLRASAKSDAPYFAVEARLAIAQLLRATDPATSRAFAEAAALTAAHPCGEACFQAIRLLAGFDLESAIRTAPLNEPAPAYRALTDDAIYNDQPDVFLDLLHQAHSLGLYGLLRTPLLAAHRWKGDEQFLADLEALLVDDLPEPLRPANANYLFEMLRLLDPDAKNPELIREGVSRVLAAIDQPVFNLPDPWQMSTTFKVRGRTVQTYSRAEAAYLEALAFGAVLDPDVFLNDSKSPLPVWAPALKGISIQELKGLLYSTSFTEPARLAPPDRGNTPPDFRLIPFDQALSLIRQSSSRPTRTAMLVELAGRRNASESQYEQLLTLFSATVSQLDELPRFRADNYLYAAAIQWPRIPQQDMAVSLFVREMQTFASMNTDFAASLRDNGDLLNRLDDVVERLGRTPAQWPEILRKNATLLTRHFVYEAQQAALYATIDATFPLAGGGNLTLRGLRGQVVVVLFCPCEPIREAINRINLPPGKHGIRAIAVSRDPEDVVLASLDRRPFWASMAFDPYLRIARSLGARSTAVLIVDRQGRVIARIPRNKSSAEELYRAIESAGVTLPDRVKGVH